mgnify:CR=1 FL=1
MVQTFLRKSAILLAAAALWGCDGGGSELKSFHSAIQYSQNTQCTTLFAGQTIDAGSVCVSVDSDNLVVSYATTGGWQLTEAHLWVGDDLANMPRVRSLHASAAASVTRRWTCRIRSSKTRYSAHDPG